MAEQVLFLVTYTWSQMMGAPEQSLFNSINTQAHSYQRLSYFRNPRPKCLRTFAIIYLSAHIKVFPFTLFFVTVFNVYLYSEGE